MQALTSGKYYHIYNCGNAGENLFSSHRNYAYFLAKYHQYLSPFVETYAYCLMPDHFRLFIKVKPAEAFPQSATAAVLDNPVSEQFRRLFMSYAKAYNSQHDRIGSLFRKNFKRKEVDNKSFFAHLVTYIHAQPRFYGHGLDFQRYPWSSYDKIVRMTQTIIDTREVLSWFGGVKRFVETHQLVSMDIDPKYRPE